MSDDGPMLELIRFLERMEMSANFYKSRANWVTGVPKCLGFDIDIGYMIEVQGKGHSETIALHDFTSVVIINPDHPRVQEFHL